MNFVLCVEDWDDLFIRSQTFCTYKISKYNEMINIDKNLPCSVYSVSNKNIHIPVIQKKNPVHSICYRGNNRVSSGGIQVENDSISMLHTFYDGYTQYNTNERMLYFLQLGIHRILSDKNVTVGIGKRYMCNYVHGIGYNTMLNLPILNNNQDYPYSINIGGEYWYRNFSLVLNGYYNLNQILCFGQSSCLNYLEYPMMGYQIYIQSILPYLSECRSHIKLSKFFYNKKRHNEFFNNPNDYEHTISIGIGYKPVPMLDFSIDNVFFKTRYVNTLFKIALHYQFNMSIAQQLKQKRHTDNALNLNNFNTVLKPFLPEIVPIESKYAVCNVSKLIHRIAGYSEEVKYIKIHHSNSTSLRWNTVTFERNGGKVVYLGDYLYAIYLPKYHVCGNNQIFLSCTEQDENNIVRNQHRIFIVIEKFQNICTNTEICNDDSLIKTENTQISNTLEGIVGLSENNQLNQSSTSAPNVLNNHQDYVSSSLDPGSVNETNDEALQNLRFNNDHNNASTSFVPIPPPIPNLLLFLEKQQQPQVTSSFFKLDKQLCISVKKDDMNQKTDESSASDHASVSVLHSSDRVPHVLENIDSNTNTKNLFYQLLMQRKNKFSLIGTKEYIEKLEKSIVERKQVRYAQHDMGKILNRLFHSSLSDSSLEESCNTDDDTDSFSESSKN